MDKVDSQNEKVSGPQMSFKDWKLSKGVVEQEDETPQQKMKSGNRRNDKFNKHNNQPAQLNINLNQNSFCNGGVRRLFNNGPLNLNFDQNSFCNSGVRSLFNNGPLNHWNFRGLNFSSENCGKNSMSMRFNGSSSATPFNGRNISPHFNGQSRTINCNGVNGGRNGGMGFNDQSSNSTFKCRNSGTNQNFNKSRDRAGHNRNDNIGYNSQDDDLFKTDEMYPQKDMIEYSIASNPFRNNSRARQLLNELNNSKKQAEKKKVQTNKPRKNIDQTTVPSGSLNEPNVVNKNPRNETNKKSFKPMPKPPENEIRGTLEERKQQWKDYREAMKPFKNREFYNAKRVVQRLGKKDPSELDEKERFRLSNAQEKMAQYKQKLSEKYDHYVQSPNNTSSETGELFVLKRGTHSKWPSKSKANPAQYKNYGNFGESLPSSKINMEGNGLSSEPGRKILGGTSNYSSFVSGGTLEGTLATQY